MQQGEGGKEEKIKRNQMQGYQKATVKKQDNDRVVKKHTGLLKK